MPRTARVAVLEDTDETEEEVKTFRRRPKGQRAPSGKVHHWAQVWFGQSQDNNPEWYDWKSGADDIEVAVQDYGLEGWMEDLEGNMVDAAKELISQADPEFTAVRLRVRLFSHRDDGDDARFTVEHIRKRS